MGRLFSNTTNTPQTGGRLFPANSLAPTLTQANSLQPSTPSNALFTKKDPQILAQMALGMIPGGTEGVQEMKRISNLPKSTSILEREKQGMISDVNIWKGGLNWLKGIPAFLLGSVATPVLTGSEALGGPKKFGPWSSFQEQKRQLQQQGAGQFASTALPIGQEALSIAGLKGTVTKGIDFAKSRYDTTGIPGADVKPPATLKEITDTLPADPNVKPSIPSNQGPLARLDFIGTKNQRIVETNQLALNLDKLLPNKLDREALGIYREIQGNPDRFAEIQKAQASGADWLKPYEKVVNRVLNPTPDLALRFQKANQYLDTYFGGRLQEGQQLGYIKGDIQNYLTHIISKGQDAGNFQDVIPKPQISKTTPFGQGRTYADIMDAIKSGETPATLDVSDILRIYGQRDAVANSTVKMIQHLKDNNIGKWFHPDEVPQDWQNLSQYSQQFKNVIPITAQDGTPAKVSQEFAVPKDVADSLKPILQPDYLKNIGGIGKFRAVQSWAKYVELSVSLFHAKALSLVSLASQGPVKSFKALFNTDTQSPAFQEAEQYLAKSGGTSPIMGQEYEAFKGIKPQGKNILLNNPLTKTFDYVADKVSGVTFDQIQRRFKVQDFANRMAKWTANNHEADQTAIDAQAAKTANLVNDLYGGLNWENLGVTKSMQTSLRLALLAPDWTISNFLAIAQALPEGVKTKLHLSNIGDVPVGATAQWYGVALTMGVLASQLTNLATHGKVYPDHPFEVYLGKRKDGTDIYANTFLPGAVKDFSSLISKGPIDLLVTKASPLTKTIAEEVVNRDYYGNPIRLKGATNLDNIIRTGKHLSSSIPIPFSLSTPFQNIQSSKGQALPSELALQATGMGTIRKVNPRQDYFNQIKAQSMQAGDSDLISTLKALSATNKKFGKQPKTIQPKKTNSLNNILNYLSP
jgi:hypothetical protein